MWALLQTHYSKHHQAYVSKLNGEASSCAGALISAVHHPEMRAASTESEDARSNCRGMQSQGQKLRSAQPADRPHCSLSPLRCKACAASIPGCQQPAEPCLQLYRLHVQQHSAAPRPALPAAVLWVHARVSCNPLCCLQLLAAWQAESGDGAVPAAALEKAPDDLRNKNLVELVQVQPLGQG